MSKGIIGADRHRGIIGGNKNFGGIADNRNARDIELSDKANQNPFESDQESYKTVEKARKEENKKLQAEYSKQLKTFSEDKDFDKNYQGITVQKRGDVLVKIFNFSPKGGKKSGIFQSDGNNGWTKDIGSVKTVPTNIAKVIASESESGYKPGDLVLLKFNDVQGTVKNPEWEHYEVALRAKGVDAIPPEDLRKFIPAIEMKFSRYKFKKPGNYVMDEEDRSTFCLPSLEIVGKI